MAHLILGVALAGPLRDDKALRGLRDSFAWIHSLHGQGRVFSPCTRWSPVERAFACAMITLAFDSFH